MPSWMEKSVDKQVKNVAPRAIRQYIARELVPVQTRLDDMSQSAQSGLEQIARLELLRRANAHDRAAYEELKKLGRSNPGYAAAATQIEAKYQRFAINIDLSDPVAFGLPILATNNEQEFLDHIRSADIAQRLGALRWVRHSEYTHRLLLPLRNQLDAEPDLRALAGAIMVLKIGLLGGQGLNTPGVLDAESAKDLWEKHHSKLRAK
jgi:hypothetical protein